MKHVLPILHSFGIISFDLSIVLPKFYQYFIVGISFIETIINVSTDLDNAIEMIPNECRICDTCFTSLATIEGNLYTRHPKNLNHVHKDSKVILSVIIILGTDVHGGETVFNMERI